MGWATEGFSRIGGWARFGTGVLCLLAAAEVIPASAETLTGYAEWTASRLDTRDSIGDVGTESSVRAFLQRYSLTFLQNPSPTTNVEIGGIYEQQDATAGPPDLRVSTTTRLLIPRVLLGLRSGPFVTSFLVQRRADSLSTGPVRTRLVNDTYQFSAGLFPQGLPYLRLDLLRTDSHDLDRVSLDRLTDQAALGLDWFGWRGLRVNARATEADIQDRIAGTRIRASGLTGRVTFAETTRSGRINYGGDVAVRNQHTRVVRAGTGEIVEPLYPIAGLSLIDATPQRNTLVSNPALIDNDVVAGAGINLGLPPLGGDRRPRNFGVDFGRTVTFNTLVVTVDRAIPPEIAAAFSWTVWTGDNNLDWTLVQTFPTATFRPLDNAFELRLGDLASRYVKVVVSPLTDAVQGASSFPNLIVTELSPQILRKASDTALATSSTGATYNLTFSARLLRSVPLMYQASLLGTEGSNVPSTYDFVNALSIAMALDPVWSVSGRIAFDHRDNGTYATNGVTYAAAVNAVPIPKIRHSLQLNGDRQDTLGDIRTTNTAAFSSTLEFYRGVYTDFSASKSVVRISNGFAGDTTAASVGLTLVPHRTFEFRASANTARLKNSGGPVIVPVVTDAYTTELTSTWTPFPSLRLYASRRWTRSIGQAEASFRDYAADWTPFPYGSLHLAVSYTDGYRSDLAATTRTFAPLLRWDITRRAYLSLSYQDLSYQSVVQTTVSRTWFATLRIGF